MSRRQFGSAGGKFPGRLRARRPLMVGAVAVVAMIVAWEAMDRLALIDVAVIPAPTLVGQSLVQLTAEPDFWIAVWTTLASTGSGLILAALTGILTGVLYGTFPWVQRSTTVLIELMRPIPPVALLPVGLLLLGTSFEMKVALIWYTAFWPVFIQTAYGMRDIEGVLIDMSRIHRVPLRRRLLSIVLPSIGPYVAVGLRLSAIGALVASIVTELIGGAAGLGNTLSVAQSVGNYPLVYALIFVTGILGLAINELFGMAERSVLAWNPAHREPGN